jgi:hypothetical protein
MDLEAQDFFATDAVAMAEKAVQQGFIRKVYGILCAQLAVTVCIAAPISFSSVDWVQSHQWIALVALGMAFVTVLIPCVSPKIMKTYPQNFIFLGVYTVCIAISVGFFAAAYTAESVVLVFLLTCVVTGALTAYAYKTETDYTESGGYLLTALVVMLVTGVLMAFFPAVPLIQKLYAGAGAMLFGGYIVYDTQLILGGKHRNKFGVDDYVFAAMNIYIDIINEFQFLLELIGERR